MSSRTILTRQNELWWPQTSSSEAAVSFKLRACCLETVVKRTTALAECRKPHVCCGLLSCGVARALWAIEPCNILITVNPAQTFLSSGLTGLKTNSSGIFLRMRTDIVAHSRCWDAAAASCAVGSIRKLTESGPNPLGSAAEF